MTMCTSWVSHPARNHTPFTRRIIIFFFFFFFFIIIIISSYPVEKDPFVYNYDRLRIGGIIFTVLLVIGAIVLLFYDKCGTKKKSDDAASQI
ncbi:hypothetical protein QTP70_024606 [Hemibagrus guttatus]|uniref:FXYD domain-containing ion transport regulator n=1 Tax=Hemibagrus guttatus TaxID=175788 RepID=A0AAE0Q8K6_9TELE|nr:hypothetical protein QTP70_024606 [Hemibagrus guttatus]